jgi:hypothetical protein
LPSLTSFRAVTAPTVDDVIAIGAIGTVTPAAVDSGDSGTTWKEDDLGTTQALHAIWSAGPQDVYAVGENGTILHGH